MYRKNRRNKSIKYDIVTQTIKYFIVIHSIFRLNVILKERKYLQIYRHHQHHDTVLANLTKS